VDGTHLDDHQLLDLAMGQSPLDEDNSGRDHCYRCPRCQERLESLRPLVDGLVQLSEAEEVPTPSVEVRKQLFGRAEPLLDEFRRNHGASADKRPAQAELLAPERRWAVAASAGLLQRLGPRQSRVDDQRRTPRRRHLLRRSWAVTASVLLLVGAASGGWLFWSNMVPTAAAAIVETTGSVKITSPGQPSRCCRSEKELLRVGDVLSTPEADGAIRLDDETRLSLRQGCRLEAQRPVAERQAAFKLRAGSLCVDTTQAKRGCCVKAPGGTVRCGKAKTLIHVTSPQESTVATLEGEVKVQCGGHVGVVSTGVCAELKRSKPCCYRPARPKDTRCDWVDRCGKPKVGRKN